MQSSTRALLVSRHDNFYRLVLAHLNLSLFGFAHLSPNLKFSTYIGGFPRKYQKSITWELDFQTTVTLRIFEVGCRNCVCLQAGANRFVSGEFFLDQVQSIHCVGAPRIARLHHHFRHCRPLSHSSPDPPTSPSTPGAASQDPVASPASSPGSASCRLGG